VKLLPVTVSVKATPLAGPEAGERVATVGSKLLALIVKVSPPEAPPAPPFCTMT
jgi:hypothetical protein